MISKTCLLRALSNPTFNMNSLWKCSSIMKNPPFGGRHRWPFSGYDDEGYTAPEMSQLSGGNQLLINYDWLLTQSDWCQFDGKKRLVSMVSIIHREGRSEYQTCQSEQTDWTAFTIYQDRWGINASHDTSSCTGRLRLDDKNPDPWQPEKQINL